MKLQRRLHQSLTADESTAGDKMQGGSSKEPRTYASSESAYETDDPNAKPWA